VKLAIGIAMLLAACASEEPRPLPAVRTPASPVVARPLATETLVATAEPALATKRRIGHTVLAKNCGECHEGHRSTAVAKALAIFDLDRSDWPARFDNHRFEVALKRLSSKPEADRAAFIAFRDAELATR
jgi:cytochrome c5